MTTEPLKPPQYEGTASTALNAGTTPDENHGDDSNRTSNSA